MTQPAPVPTPTPVAPPNEAPVAPLAPVQPTPTPPVITPGANTMPVASVDTTTRKTPKFNFPGFKELLSKLKALPLKYKIMAGVVITLILLLVLVGFTQPGKKVAQLILPTQSPIPTTEPVGDVFEPSIYANDPEVLELEQQVNEFDGMLGSTDLREDNLRVPNLDWNVDFKKQ